MPRLIATLTLDEAKRALAAGEKKAANIGIAYNVASVDAGGNLLAFVRKDGALIGSIDLAINKAVTARIFDKTTKRIHWSFSAYNADCYRKSLSCSAPVGLAE